MGGCTLFVAYKLAVLGIFPSLFANSVWLNLLLSKLLLFGLFANVVFIVANYRLQKYKI